MSIQNDLRKELLEIKLPACCRKAFLSGVTRGTGTLILESGGWNLRLENGNKDLIERCVEHINSVLKIQPEVYKKTKSGGLGNRTLYGVTLTSEEANRLLSVINVDSPGSLMECADLIPLSKKCCVTSYVRGLFLSSGSLVVEERNESTKFHTKGYFLEIVITEEELARRLAEILAKNGLEPKLRQRKNVCSMYFKGAEAVGDFLAFVGANKTYFALQEILIKRSVNNNINRQSNCDTANLDRAMNAANKQHDAVLLIQSTIGLDALDKQLRSLAEARLENPLTPLQELAEFIPDAPGKSGLRHRMDKLVKLAEDIRNGNK